MNKKQILARMQEIISGARNASRGLTDDERTELNNLQRSLDDMNRAAGSAEQGDGQASGQEAPAGEGSRALGAQPEPVNHQNEINSAIAGERARTAEIMSMCRSFNIDPTAYIDGGLSVEAARVAIMDGMIQNGAPIGQRSDGGARVIADEADKYRAAAVDGILLRSGLNVQSRADGCSDFSRMSLHTIAVDCLAREGHNEKELRRMAPSEVFDMVMNRDFYNPSAAFPAIMDATVRKSIVELYNNVPTTFQQWTSEGSVSDFKATKDHEYLIGGVGDFEMVPENGEIKADKPRTELMPTRKVETYGKSFSMSRQAFINDDIGFVTRVPGLYATKAKQTIDRNCYKLLFNNGKVFDGKTLFHADHKNVVANGSKPSQASIQAMILQMQKQTDPFGEPIYMTPANIIVPVGYEFDLAVIFHSAQVVGSSNNDINPLYNYPLKTIQSPVLNALAGSNACPWFMTASPASSRGIQVDYLNGQKTPTVRRMEKPGTLGFVWDIYFDWGITVRDFRGIYKNPGVQV